MKMKSFFISFLCLVCMDANDVIGKKKPHKRVSYRNRRVSSKRRFSQKRPQSLRARGKAQVRGPNKAVRETIRNEVLLALKEFAEEKSAEKNTLEEEGGNISLNDVQTITLDKVNPPQEEVPSGEKKTEEEQEEQEEQRVQEKKGEEEKEQRGEEKIEEEEEEEEAEERRGQEKTEEEEEEATDNIQKKSFTIENPILKHIVSHKEKYALLGAFIYYISGGFHALTKSYQSGGVMSALGTFFFLHPLNMIGSSFAACYKHYKWTQELVLDSEARQKSLCAWNVSERLFPESCKTARKFSIK